ncbi:MAG: GGDEF domain-containing protein [Pirellulales bacterium]
MQDVARAAAALVDLPPMDIRRAGDAVGDGPTGGDPRNIDVVLSDRVVSAAELRDALAGQRRKFSRVLLESSPSHPAPQHATEESTSSQWVVLPTDATPREIRLACVLAGDAVHWRRRLDVRSQKEKRLRKLSFADPLTGVGNLRAWTARLAAARRRVRDEGASVCLALFDVDHFKTVNDTWGHATGDNVLRGVAERLSASVRDGDFVARLGGDEFGLILANLAAEHGEKSIDRVRQELSSAYSTGESQTIDVTASAGWCAITASETGDTADAAVQRADAALRAAKRLGRNQTQSPTETRAAGDEGERSA